MNATHLSLIFAGLAAFATTFGVAIATADYVAERLADRRLGPEAPSVSTPAAPSVASVPIAPQSELQGNETTYEYTYDYTVETTWEWVPDAAPAANYDTRYPPTYPQQQYQPSYAQSVEMCQYEINGMWTAPQPC